LKALSLWQPYASFIACWAKREETRGWYTGYRGLVAIHASKRIGEELIEAYEARYAACDWYDASMSEWSNRTDTPLII